MSGGGYGALTPDQIAVKTGLELFQALLRGEAPQAPISQPMRFDLVEAEFGFCAFEGEPDMSLINPLGNIHGGWALTLIESAAGCAAHTTLPAGVGYATVETHCNFTRAIRPNSGTLRCEGRVLNAGKSLITAEAVLKDAEGRIAAHGGSTLMVLQMR